LSYDDSPTPSNNVERDVTATVPSREFAVAESMYDVALEAFRCIVACGDEGELRSHVESLQPAVRQLRAGYRSSRVVVEYGAATNAYAYLLAYVPAYIRMAERVFARVLNRSAVDRVLKVGLVGAGPAPEAVALVNHLRRSPRVCEHLNIHLFDIATSAWMPVRGGLLEVGCEARWPGTINVAHHDLDLTRPSAVTPHREILADLDLIVVQNCLNEDIARRPAGMENLRELLSGLKPGASLAIADQYNYDSVRESLRLLADGLDRELTVLSRFEDAVRSRLSDPIPALLKAHLLTGADGLIPRTRLEFGLLAVRSGSVVAPLAVSPPAEVGPPRRPVASNHRSLTPDLSADHLPQERALAEIRQMFLLRDATALTGALRTLDAYRKSQKPVVGVVVRVDKGHLVLDVAGVDVFVKADDIEFAYSPRDLSSYIGRRLSVILVAVGANQVRGSRRAHLARQRLERVQRVSVGSRLSGFVRELTTRTAVVDVEGLDVVVPMNALSHGPVDAVGDVVTLGQEVEVRVTQVDHGRVRLFGSIAECTPDLLEDFAAEHQPGQLVAGEVVALAPKWAEVVVAGLAGRIHISKISVGWITHPSDSLTVGEEIWATYLGLRDERKHRYLELSITDMHTGSPVAPDFADLWTD
jgi:predicted RNA-binding protein with RPS1 domain